MLLKSRASLTCFPACFLPGRAKDLSTPRVYIQADLQLWARIVQSVCRLATNWAVRGSNPGATETFARPVQIFFAHPPSPSLR